MSRIGKKPIPIPSGVKVQLDGDLIKVEGPKGRFVQPLKRGINIDLTPTEIKVVSEYNTRDSRAIHGLTRSLIANMVKGVTEGFEKTLEISGIGYKAELQGSVLNLSLGYSHPVRYPLPEGVSAEIEKQTLIRLRGADKYILGQVAADIRAYRIPDPYKGKGIKYAGEVIRRKAGKAGKATGG